jgi:translation initiation factor 3 subunit D
MRPMDFAAQLNVSLANGWGIVRTVADLCLKMPEGKYVLVKDPNKVSVYPCFVVCVAVMAHFTGTANFRATRINGCSRSLFLQPVIRLYAVPFSAFTGEEEEEEGAASEVEVES